MSLPVYHHIHLKDASLENLSNILNPSLNLKNPVVIHLETLNLDDQREIIGLLENYFVEQNLSFKFPYPLYLISHHEPSITRIALFNRQEELPKFFSQKESRMNVKEAHLAGRNKLLQQEVRNTDSSANEKDLQHYGESHRIIFELEKERRFYKHLLTRLTEEKKDG